jgi:Tfp pilus assembly protein FimT
LAELAVTVLILGVILGAAILSFFSATRGSAIVSAREQIKSELRKVYSLTDSGEKSAQGYRNRYKITFHDATEVPPNAYRVEKGVSSNGTVYTWSVVPATKSTSNKVLTGDWVAPSNDVDCRLTYSTPTITFMSMGSIMQTDQVADWTVTVTSAAQGGGKTISVTTAGSVN